MSILSKIQTVFSGSLGKRVPIVVAQTGFIILGCLSLVALDGWRSWNAHELQLKASEIETNNLARSLSQHAEDTIKSADTVILGVVERLEYDGITPASLERLHKLLMRRVVELPQLQRLSAIGADGHWLVNSQEVMSSNPDNSDREYFKYHITHTDRGPHIGAPIRAKSTGQWIFTVSRRFNHPDGSFAGVALASIDINYLQKYYDSFDIGAGGAIALVMDNATLLVRRPYDEAMVGKSIAGASLFTDLLPKSPSGSATQVSVIDGVERLFSYRHLDRYPLVVSAALSKQDILATWRSDTIFHSLWASLIAVVLGLVGFRVVRQIRLRLKAEQELFWAKERLRLAADSVGMGVWDWDVHSNALMGDKQMYLLYWLDPEGSSNKYEMWRDRVHPDDLVRVENLLQAALRGEAEYHLEFRLVGPARQIRYLQAAAVVLRDDDGRAVRMVGVNRDITSERETAMELVQAKDMAEAASRSKSEFLANMSHEIRTPMNAVLGMTHLLGTTELLPFQKKYVDMIRASGRSLLAILNDILDFSKIEAGRMELSSSHFEIDDIFKSLASVMTVSAGEKDLELAIGIEPDVPQKLIGDPLRLQQVLINLATNAIKFTEKGEVSILAELVSRGQDQAVLRFRIRDTGIGMNEAQRGNLFVAFAQADNSVTRRFGGTGLGLAISKRLVDMMGGEIGVDSEYGRGSEFWFTVKVGVAADRAIAPGNAHLDELRLLVVDDKAVTRSYLSKIIKLWGWDTDSVESGAQAIELFRASVDQGRAYDIILVDWKMPGMDGLQTMQAIRNESNGSEMPVVIMVNAFGREQLAHDGHAANIDAILTKPITGSSLFDTVHEAMVKRGRAASVTSGGDIASLSATLLSGRRLLLVEDNLFNQTVACGILEQAGAIVDVVDNGLKAVDTLRRDALRYDLVLMDVQMPVMDGFSATRIIRAELMLDLPVIAMSAGVMESEREQCTASGMNDFIAKPLDVEQMLAVLARHLQKKARIAGQPVAAEAAKDVAREAAKEAEKNGSQPAPLFSADRWMKSLKNNPAARKRMLQLVQAQIERGSAPIDEARQAWTEGRAQDAAKIFHTLRGELGIWCTQPFIDATVNIEKALLEKRDGELDAMFISMLYDIDAVIRSAAQWLEKQRVIEGE